MNSAHTSRLLTATLTRRRVNPEDVALCEERFNKSKMVRTSWAGRSSGELCG